MKTRERVQVKQISYIYMTQFFEDLFLVIYLCMITSLVGPSLVSGGHCVLVLGVETAFSFKAPVLIRAHEIFTTDMIKLVCLLAHQQISLSNLDRDL